MCTGVEREHYNIIFKNTLFLRFNCTHVLAIVNRGELTLVADIRRCKNDRCHHHHHYIIIIIIACNSNPRLREVPMS